MRASDKERSIALYIVVIGLVIVLGAVIGNVLGKLI